jgi:Cytochrome c554 and c-prime
MRHRIFRTAITVALLLQVSALPGQLSTEDHLADRGFWPRQPATSRKDFAGPEACASCHSNKFASAQLTPMKNGAMMAATAEVLKSHPHLHFVAKQYQYAIDTGQNASRYTVTDGQRSLSYDLTWAFGTARVGQSYLFKDGEHYYEARVTYFDKLKNLGFTPDRDLASPKDLAEAMYRPVETQEIQRCFGCHTTASDIGGKFDEAHLIPGVTCEACHGPGANHVRAMNFPSAVPNADGVAIFNSAHLNPVEAVEFCGACHGSWWDVKLAGVKGVSTTRSAPYRLVTSRCWGKGDQRLECTACHDPHAPLQTEAAGYDKACLGCHLNAQGVKPSASHPGRTCPVGTENCTSCHMPKVYVPEMHDTFTDHRIRIVKAGEPFPE